MERRYHPRLPAMLRVKLYRRQQLLGIYPTRDIACEGLFLNTGRLHLKTNDIVHLQMMLGAGSCTLSGMVVHGSERGVGIVLGGEHRDVVRNILADIRNRQATPKGNRRSRSVAGIRQVHPVSARTPNSMS